MGDPAGVGPEVIAGCWPDVSRNRGCRLMVVGNAEVLRRAVALRKVPAEVVEIDSPADALPTPRRIPCMTAGSAEAAQVTPCAIDPRGGQAAYDALLRATDLALAGVVDGIVTAPLNKAALQAAGHRYPGHTELLAWRCGVSDFAMMLYLGPGRAVRGAAGLGVVHVTLHTALRKVWDELSTAGVLAKIRLAQSVLGGLKATAPRIGVAALNPHAGEEGLFGDEEACIIQPAVEQARAEGILAEGPFPADTLMVRAREGEFDGVVAMYHDQGHIALKLLEMHQAVNVTLGLPIVRTSVAHGTAFDLAWQGRAETRSMVEAIRVAARLAGRKVRSRAAGSDDRGWPATGSLDRISPGLGT